MARRAGLVVALAQAEAAGARTVEDPSALARGLLPEWDTLPVEARRAVLRGLVAQVDVDIEARRAVVVPVWAATSREA